MSDIDIEKGQVTSSVTEISTDTTPSATTAATATKSNKLSALETYRVLVGDIDAPPSPNLNNATYYQLVVEDERKARFVQIATGILIYTLVAAQVILCLGIAIGAQFSLTKNQISVLAASNTGVAVGIGVLKAMGLPDKKAVERRALEAIVQKIRYTTRKLKAGLEVDAAAEAEELRKAYEAAEAAAVIDGLATADAMKGVVPSKK